MAADCGGRTPIRKCPPGPQTKISVVKKGKMTFLTKRGKMTPFAPGTLDWGHLHRHLAPRNPPPLDTDIHDSDHYPISLRLTLPTIGFSSFVPRWNLQRADWTKFTELCELQHDRFEDPVEGIQYITDTIIFAATQNIPLTKAPKKANPVPWWNSTVRQAIAKRKRAFRTYLRTRTDQDLIIRNRERANAKRIMKQAKKESWQHFLHLRLPRQLLKYGIWFVGCRGNGRLRPSQFSAFQGSRTL